MDMQENQNEITRLITQAKCWEAETELLLDQIGLQPGWKCVDMGCGPMGILRSMGSRVGDSGQVIGVDANPHFLQAAAELIELEHLTNCRVIQGDLYHPPFKDGAFNLTHIRFVFTEVGCDHELLEIMINLTKPGGVVVSQESDWTSWSCHPFNPHWERMRHALISVYEINGGDINAGKRIYKMFKAAKLENVQKRSTIMTIPIGHPYRSGLNQMALSVKDKIIRRNIMNSDEFSECLEQCKRVVNDPQNIIQSYELIQVWGIIPLR